MNQNFTNRVLAPDALPAGRQDGAIPHLRILDDTSPLEEVIARARDALAAQQSAEGYWLLELEADCTISAEYILMMHFLNEIDEPLQARIAAYLREHQAQHDGWPLYYDGAFDMSCSVKAYMALKLAGDSPEAPHMVKARAGHHLTPRPLSNGRDVFNELGSEFTMLAFDAPAGAVAGFSRRARRSAR